MGDISLEVILWITFAFYGLFVLLAVWKRIAILHIVATLPIISLLFNLGDSAPILSISLGVILVIHIFMYIDAISG